MDWVTAESRLAELREGHGSGRDVADEARALRASVEEFAQRRRNERGDDAPTENADAVAKKAELVRRLLTVGELTLPAEADDQLVALARKLAPHIIGPAMEAEFNEAVAAYRREAEEARQQVDSLEVRLGVLESRAATLRAYRRLLDALLRRGADGGASP